MSAKKTHLTDEEAIELQEEIAEEVHIRGFTDQCPAELRMGAVAGNVRVHAHAMIPRDQQVYARRVVFVKPNKVRRFTSVNQAASKMELPPSSIYTAINSGKPLKGWQVRYADDKAGAA